MEGKDPSSSDAGNVFFPVAPWTGDSVSKSLSDPGVSLLKTPTLKSRWEQDLKRSSVSGGEF